MRNIKNDNSHYDQNQLTWSKKVSAFVLVESCAPKEKLKRWINKMCLVYQITIVKSITDTKNSNEI